MDVIEMIRRGEIMRAKLAYEEGSFGVVERIVRFMGCIKYIKIRK